MLTKFKRNVVDLFIDSVANTLSLDLSGTVTVNTSSANVTGSGTNFTVDFTVDDRLFIGSESRQVISIVNNTLMTVASAYSANATANTYKKGRLKNDSYYVFAARQSPFENEAVAANTIDDNYESHIFIHDELMFGMKITNEDVLPMVAKKQWQANTIYAIYDDKDQDLPAKTFHVITAENKVYKCIHNHLGGISEVEPSHTELGYPPEESDGYRWMYLYTINNIDYLTYATENYIPIIENANVKNAAIDGSIFNITVEANGSSYPADSGTIKTDPNGNNYIIQIRTGTSTSNDFFANCAITITNDSTNLTYVKEIRDYVSNGVGNFVILKIPFTTGQVSNNNPYSIGPYIKIDSKTGSNCIASAVMQNISNTNFTGSIEMVDIINPGKNYKQANVSVQTSTGFGSGARVRAILSPPGGHGSNVKDELYCQSVGIGVVFSNTATFSFSSDVEFRTVGILKNPLSANTIDGTGTVDLVANSLSVAGVGTKFTNELNIGDHIIYLDEEKEVVSIANNTSLTLKTPFSYTVVAESFDIRKRFFNSFFNQTVDVAASNTTPALLQPGEYILGSDGAGGGSQVQAKVAFANTSKVILTGLDKTQARGNNSVVTFVNDTVMDGVGYVVNGADTPTIPASGAKYSKTAGNTYITTVPDLKLYSGEVLYLQNLLPIQRSNTTNEQIRLVVKF
jgi:hypothetical protein